MGDSVVGTSWLQQGEGEQEDQRPRVILLSSGALTVSRPMVSPARQPAECLSEGGSPVIGLTAEDDLDAGTIPVRSVRSVHVGVAGELGRHCPLMPSRHVGLRLFGSRIDGHARPALEPAPDTGRTRADCPCSKHGEPEEDC